MSGAVLDASALLALLHDETGAACVAEVLVGARISAVNQAEVISHFVHAGMPSEAVDAMLRPLPIEVIAADAELARIAGQLRAKTASAGLSLGDRFCIALALREGAVAYTADRDWSKIAEAVSARIRVIR